jgi:hypothetical protein
MINKILQDAFTSSQDEINKLTNEKDAINASLNMLGESEEHSPAITALRERRKVLLATIRSLKHLQDYLGDYTQT